MGSLEALPTRKIPPQEKGKRQTRLGSECRGLHYCSRYHLLKAIPNVPTNPGIWKAIWSFQNHPKDRHVHLDSGSQKHPNGRKPQKRGWEGPYRCPLCCHSEETIDHLLINCDFSKEVWRRALGMQRGVAIPKDTSSLLQDWASNFPFQQKKSSQTLLCGKCSPSSFYGKYGWKEIIDSSESKRTPAQVATKIHAFLGKAPPTSVSPSAPEHQGRKMSSGWPSLGFKALRRINPFPRARIPGNSEKMNKNLINGKQRRKITFCSLTEPPKETQAWQGEEG
jgi:hypothetical protein